MFGGSQPWWAESRALLSSQGSLARLQGGSGPALSQEPGAAGGCPQQLPGMALAAADPRPCSRQGGNVSGQRMSDLISKPLISA